MKNVVCVFIGIVILLKLISTTIIPFIPGKDESWQIQGALRLSEGKGLTASMDDLSIIKLRNEKDFSKNIYNHLSNWAPLESVIIAILLSLGLTSTISIGLLHFVFFTLGIIAWTKCSTFFFQSVVTQMAFIGITVYLFFDAAGTSMFIWAIFACILLLLLKIQNGYESLSCYFSITLLTVISIYFRYQALAFALSVPILILLNSKYKPTVKLLISAVSGIVIVVSYVALTVYNRKMGVDLFSTMIFNYKNANLITLPKYLFLIIPVILTGYDLWSVLEVPFLFYLIAIILNLFFVLTIYSNKSKLSNNFRISIPVFFVSLLFLLYSSVMFGDFKVLMIGRYWWYLSPLFLIILLKPVDIFINQNMNRKIISIQLLTKAPYLLGVLILIIGINFTYKYHLRSKVYYKQKSMFTSFLEETIVNHKLDSGKIVVFTGLSKGVGLCGMLLVDNKYPAFRRLEILKDDKLYFSGGEKILIMVEKSTALNAYIGNNVSYTLLSSKYDHKIYLVNSLAAKNTK